MKKIVFCVLLLLCSNTFMNTAWYGHLKSKESPLSLTQPKIVQEVISLSTFAVFSFLVF